MADITIKVEGMTCQHCVMRIKKALDNLNGVKESDVEIGLVKINYDAGKVKKEDIEKAITETGYKVAV